jgi:cell division protein FtsI (penicillin-binding protein 3)
MSFGSGISMSPLSFAQAIGASLNGGILRPLTLLRNDPQTPLNGAQVFKPETSEQLLVLMRSNVIRGSGTRANAPGLRVGGKTGSAEKPSKGGIDRKNLISSFAAVFPTDGPVNADRYLVLIMFDSPQGSKLSDFQRLGGYVAAPVAGRVINRIAPFVGVGRKDDRFTPTNWDHAPVLNDDQTRAN